MEKQLQKLPRNCKLQLIQPKIKCSGRDTITCNYRGKIIQEIFGGYIIEFKYKGEKISEIYYTDSGFKNPELEDIKLKE